ncbi:MAG: GAF domain-containing protein [Cyanobacteria bacterium J06642_11]
MLTFLAATPMASESTVSPTGTYSTPQDHSASQVARSELEQVLKYQKVLAKVVNKIRASLPIESICSSTCQEVSQILDVDRLAIYRFDDDWSGSFINRYGFARPPWNTMQAFGEGTVWEDTHLQESKGGRYRKNESYAVQDIYAEGHSRCHIDVLEQFQIRAYALTPIFIGSRLWGLFAAYQHSGTRQWDPMEVEFLAQVAGHLGVALQYEQLHLQTQTQNTDLAKTVERQRALTEVVSNIRAAVSMDIIFQTACRELCQLLNLERAAIYKFNPDWSGAFISQYSQLDSRWESSQNFGSETYWEDTHLQDTRGGRYRNNDRLAVHDIYKMGYSRCHLEVLEQFKIRAYAIAPIFVGRQLWGLAAAYQHSSTRNWADYEVDFLAQVASQLGVAIQQAETVAESERRTVALKNSMARQRTLTEVVGKIRSSLDTDLILQTTCQEVCDLLKVERVAVFQFEEDWSGSFVSHFGITDEVGTPWGSDAKGFGKKLVWEDTHLQDTKGGRYRNNETFAVPDVYKAGHTRCHLDILEQFKIRAYALAPIFVGNRLWGLLAAYQHSSSRQWNDVEVEFLAQVATQLGVAIKSADLLSETQTRAEEQRQSAEQRQILFDVVVKIRDSLELQTILSTASQEVRRSLGADRVAVFSFDPESDFCRGEFVAEDVVPFLQSAMGEVVEDKHFGRNHAAAYAQGKIQVLSDVQSTNLADCYGDLLNRFQVRAHIVVPLMTSDRLLGLLCVHQCSQPRDWSEADISFVSQVAAQLSVALQQVELLTQTKNKTEQLASTITDLQNAQLRIIQSEKMASLGQLVAGIAHEINNPVNFIQGNIDHADEYVQDLLKLVKLYDRSVDQPSVELEETLKRLDIDFMSEDFPKLLMSMRLGTERISEFVHSLRNFSRLDETQHKVADLHEGIESALMILQNRLDTSKQHPAIHVLKDYDDLPLVSCYPGQMNQVFMNLLSTLIDELAEYDRLRPLDDILANPSILRVSTQVKNNRWVSIQISNNGPGMTEEARLNLFDSPLMDSASGRTSRLGLPISYQIVTEKHSGKLYCTSAPGKGTGFIIEIPIQQQSMLSDEIEALV